jgi:hypothetical protein
LGVKVIGQIVDEVSPADSSSLGEEAPNHIVVKTKRVYAWVRPIPEALDLSGKRR